MILPIYCLVERQMKTEIGRDGRKIYKFSSCVSQGGFVYAHKTKEGEKIANKEGLRNALRALAKRFELIDVTIKIYDATFFFFYMTTPSVKPNELLESLQKNISSFAKWDTEHLHTGAYDLQDSFIRKDLKNWGFEYEKG